MAYLNLQSLFLGYFIYNLITDTILSFILSKGEYTGFYHRCVLRPGKIFYTRWDRKPSTLEPYIYTYPYAFVCILVSNSFWFLRTFVVDYYRTYQYRSSYIYLLQSFLVNFPFRARFSSIISFPSGDFPTLLITMASRDIQSAYDEAARTFNTTSTAIAQAIVASKDKRLNISSDEMSSTIAKLSNSNNIYVRRSVKNRLLRHIKPTVIGHYDSQIVRAGGVQDSEAPTQFSIPLTPLVVKHLKKLDKEFKGAVFTRDARGMITGSARNRSLAFVNVDIVSLHTTSLVTASNAGVVLALAVDSRATEPCDAVLGGHLMFNKDTKHATSIFFPNLTLSTEEKDLDNCVGIYCVAKGFDLKNGIAASVEYSAVGEVKTSSIDTSMFAPIMMKLQDMRHSTLATSALPIHAYRAKENKIDKISMPWKSSTNEMRYVPSISGSAEWRSFTTGDSSSIDFTNLRSLTMNRLERGGRDHIVDSSGYQSDGSYDEELERNRGVNASRAQQETSFQTVEASEAFYAGLDKKELLGKDCLLFTKEFKIPEKTEDCDWIGKIDFFEDFEFDAGGNNAFMLLQNAAIIIPDFYAVFRLSIPAAYSCPVVAVWDEGRYITEKTTIETAFQLPFTLVNSISGNITERFHIEMYGTTGSFTMGRQSPRRSGQLCVAALGHDFVDLQGKAFVSVELWASEKTIISEAFIPHNLHQLPTVSVTLSDTVIMPKIQAGTFLGSLIYDSISPTDVFALVSVMPGVGSVSKDRKTLQPSMLSNVCSLWNHWEGVVNVRVDVSTRNSVAGRFSVYILPVGHNGPNLSRQNCTQYPRKVFNFSGSASSIIQVKPESWLGVISTCGSRQIGKFDKDANILMLAVFLDTPPCAVGGVDSKVEVFFSIANMENVKLHGRASLSTLRGPNPSRVLKDSQSWVDRQLMKPNLLPGTSENRANEEGSYGEQPKCGYRMYTLRNLKHDKDTTWILPFCASEPIRSNWKNCEVSTYEALEDHGKITTHLLLIDTTNPLRVLTQSACYYEASLRATISVTSTKKKAGALTAGCFSNAYFKAAIGVNTLEGDKIVGGLMQASVLTPSNVVTLQCEPTTYMRTRCRPDLTPKTRRLHDVPTYIVITIPANTDITEIEVGFDFVGQMNMYGFGVANEIRAKKDSIFRPHIYSVGDLVLPILPVGRWDLDTNDKPLGKWHHNCIGDVAGKEESFGKRLMSYFSDNIFRVYQVWEASRVATNGHDITFKPLNYSVGSHYVVNMQLWIGIDRGSMIELIWHFNDDNPTGCFYFYGTQCGRADWDLDFEWDAEFDRGKKRKGAAISYHLTDQGFLAFYVNRSLAGIYKRSGIVQHMAFGWEYQIDRTQKLVPKQGWPYCFTPSGNFKDIRTDGVHDSISLVRLWHTSFQSTTYPIERAPIGKLSLPICAGRDDWSVLNDLIEENDALLRGKGGTLRRPGSNIEEVITNNDTFPHSGDSSRTSVAKMKKKKRIKYANAPITSQDTPIVPLDNISEVALPDDAHRLFNESSKNDYDEIERVRNNFGKIRIKKRKKSYPVNQLNKGVFPLSGRDIPPPPRLCELVGVRNYEPLWNFCDTTDPFSFNGISRIAGWKDEDNNHNIMLIYARANGLLESIGNQLFFFGDYQQFESCILDRNDRFVHELNEAYGQLQRLCAEIGYMPVLHPAKSGSGELEFEENPVPFHPRDQKTFVPDNLLIINDPEVKYMYACERSVCIKCWQPLFQFGSMPVQCICSEDSADEIMSNYFRVNTGDDDDLHLCRGIGINEHNQIDFVDEPGISPEVGPYIVIQGPTITDFDIADDGTIIGRHRDIICNSTDFDCDEYDECYMRRIKRQTKRRPHFRDTELADILGFND
uniref:Polyprotein n=1 Tax=Chrysanthemum stramovirus TaxID=3115812 RepID=A0AAT9JAY3_9SECO